MQFLTSRNALSHIVLVLIILSVSSFAWAQGQWPSQQTASCGTAGMIPANWTMPSGGTGAFRYAITVYDPGIYGLFIRDNTTGNYIIYAQSHDQSTLPCTNPAEYTANLTAGHSYTMTIEWVSGTTSRSVSAKVTMFYTCSQQ